MHGRIYPQHNHQVHPALGEKITSVPVDYAPAGLALILNSVEKLSPDMLEHPVVLQ